MSDNVYWILEAKINNLDDLTTLMHEMVESTQAETGALNYEWHVSEDKTICHIYERYADSAATMVHLGNFGAKFAGRFMAALEVTRFVVYGSPDEQVVNALSPMGVLFMPPFGGFVR